MTESAEPVGGFRSYLQAIDDYWFGRGSPTALGLFRILVGTLSLANVCLLGLHWESWFSEKGYMPDWLAERSFTTHRPFWWNNQIQLPVPNLLNGVTDPRIAIPFFCLVGVVSLMSALGIWTKFSTVAMAIGVVSIQYRNTLILHGGDTVIRLWCIYLAVSPCGRACSLDRMIGLWRGKIAPGPVSVSLWSQRLITYNLALIYFTTIWLKWDGSLWKQGLATYFPARLAEFYRFPYPHFVNDLPFVRLTTWGTLLTEFSMGTLVFFRPLRKYVLLAGLAMHGWIEYSMNIPLFSFLMCSTYVCFYDGEEVSAWAKRMGDRLRRVRATVYMPKGMRLRPASAAFLDAADPFKLVAYLPSESDEWSAARENGSPLRPAFASWSRSLGAWIVAGVPAVWWRFLDRSLEPAPMPLPVEAPAPQAATLASGSRKRTSKR